MKKNKKIILFTILLLLFNTNVYASCTEEEINGFKKIEDEYKITYEFNKETKDYTLIFNKSKNPIYEYDFSGDNDNIEKVEFEPVNETTYRFNRVQYGEYIIKIRGVTESCNDILKEININLPKYNIYFEDPLCEGLEDFVLCQPTYDKEIDYETFVSRTNTEIKKRKKEAQEQTNEPKDDYKDSKIFQYIKDNLFKIIIITIFIIMIIITVVLMSKSIKKSRRLE